MRAGRNATARRPPIAPAKPIVRYIVCYVAGPILNGVLKWISHVMTGGWAISPISSHAASGPECSDFGWGGGKHRHRRRSPMFESGEVKFQILRLLKEKPRHGYEVIKALEEKLAGCYTASPGTVTSHPAAPEDQGYVRVIEEGGKKVYLHHARGRSLPRIHQGRDRRHLRPSARHRARLCRRANGRSAPGVCAGRERDLQARLALGRRPLGGAAHHRDPETHRGRDRESGPRSNSQDPGRYGDADGRAVPELDDVRAVRHVHGTDDAHDVWGQAGALGPVRGSRSTGAARKSVV